MYDEVMNVCRMEVGFVSVFSFLNEHVGNKVSWCRHRETVGWETVTGRKWDVWDLVPHVWKIWNGGSAESTRVLARRTWMVRDVRWKGRS